VLATNLDAVKLSEASYSSSDHGSSYWLSGLGVG